MDYELRHGYRCTNEGLELLTRFPDFLTNGITQNRELLFTKEKKVFTRITYRDSQYIEKTGTDWREFHPYRRMARIVRDDVFSHIRVATPLFGNDNSIILPYYKHAYNPQLDGRNPIEPNEEAKEELWDILTTGIPMDFCIEENGDLIILDPHV